MIPQEIIKAKRNGGSLSQAEIKQFVKGLTDDSFSEGQVAALAMAIYLNGMSVDEIVMLTLAMRDSGTVLNWQGKLNGPVVDKHSTGGVGDKVTLMLAPMVAACGAFMPSIAGRGLGHTGGTVDKLETIPGYSCTQSLEKISQLLPKLGCVIVGQSSQLAPADRRLYAIRDVTATVESIPLITASILSKKLSEGLDALVMDVKIGNGAIMRTVDDASALANSIVNVANGAGVSTRALLTDMNQILGATAGNALEVMETLDYLTGKYREPRLHQVTLELGANMLTLGGLYQDKASAIKALEHSLSSGKAAEIFARMVSALGGPADLIEKPQQYLASAPVVQDVVAPADGYVSYQDTVALGMAVVRLGGGRSHPSQQIDPAVGFSQIAAAGTQVRRGDVLARVHAASNDAAQVAGAEYLAALRINAAQQAAFPLLHHTIG
ncbi:MULTISPECIES: thymidine phosphorylase [Rheinheimera]|jgi:thymidine phosphorylase|uniref:Thymidine phosphorylase n=3 Tax=Rheinheimera TaxID=67575 RepID=A0ABN1EEW7_9GAMM|nr:MULTISPECIES: thymidine phosphorylase [Rheinheimera]MCB5215481.1 thymidine phosphorylase [Rheinheimera aquimaris]MCD1599599.1 thymidine phosphorylase [Rheinheimera aquimaris]|tara:strand:- start:1285 stop:2598 length:1314 start_codon:yes stop_codon:yes gene_type:complete